MIQSLLLSSRSKDQLQQIDVGVIFPDFTTVGYPHAGVRLSTSLTYHGLAVDLTIRREDGTQAYSQRFVFRPDELIHNHKTRKKEG